MRPTFRIFPRFVGLTQKLSYDLRSETGVNLATAVLFLQCFLFLKPDITYSNSGILFPFCWEFYSATVETAHLRGVPYWIWVVLG